MIVPIMRGAAKGASPRAACGAVWLCAARAQRSRDNGAFVMHRPLGNLMENLVIQGVAAIAALGVYFLPSIIADRRKRYDLLTIALFNAVVGWTVFGWLLALYWALQPNPPKNVAGEIVKSRKIVSMRKFSTMLADRVRLRSSRTKARERSSK